ncbi:hypothetical protein EDD29_1293 [Actinocorallia herbida]|uniref:Uncharacterized protein n=1 Tax=Actinocorallia herbida TaxID=58109 RepID=A0A3N1CRL3_9ACTN|nr:hypothetical protein [Actinocorallia herbida]ROO83784.1 hypothetical protein EDD29_1293 [Actinocorallia herbida]
MIRKMIPAAAAFAVAAVALAGPAQAAQASEKPQTSSTQVAQPPAQGHDKDTKAKESTATKKARALCLSTGRKDAELAAKIARYDDGRTYSPDLLRTKAAKLKKSDARRASLLKQAKARQAEVAALKKQRADLAQTLRWCKAQGYATS